MTPDLDPILDRSEQTYDCEDILECERCSAEVSALYTVSSCDPSLGVHDKALVCVDCKDRNRNRCGQCV